MKVRFIDYRGSDLEFLGHQSIQIRETTMTSREFQAIEGKGEQVKEKGDSFEIDKNCSVLTASPAPKDRRNAIQKPDSMGGTPFTTPKLTKPSPVEYPGFEPPKYQIVKPTGLRTSGLDKTHKKTVSFRDIMEQEEDEFWATQHSMQEKQTKEIEKRKGNIPEPSFSSGRFKMSEHLDLIDADLRETLLRPAEPYADSTLRKHEQSKKMYKLFLTAIDGDRPLFPLDPNIIKAFIRFLCVYCGYNLKSVENVYVASLKRLNELEVHEKITDDTRKSINATISEMKRHPKVKKKDGPGKEPLITTDMDLLLASVHPGTLQGAENRSLWLFAHQTGARSISCEGITLGDVFVVLKAGEKEINTIKIRINVTKGETNWNHFVTLEGSVSEEGRQNAVYWINRHLHVGHGVYLSELHCVSAEKKKRRLWNMTRDTMRYRLKCHLEWAGYDSRVFGFHSFRSGFMCSALISADLRGNPVENVMQNTGFVAGWVVGSKTQQRYVKDLARQAIVASRMVELPELLVGEANEADMVPSQESVPMKPVFDKNLLEPSIFHNMEIKPKKEFSIRTKMQLFNYAFEKKVTYGKWSDEQKEARLSVAWRVGLAKYCKQNAELEKRCQKSVRNKLGHCPNSSVAAITQQEREVFAREHICNHLFIGMDNLDWFVNRLYSLVADKLNDAKILPRTSAEEALIKTTLVFDSRSPRKTRKLPEPQSDDDSEIIEVDGFPEGVRPIKKKKRIIADDGCEGDDSEFDWSDFCRENESDDRRRDGSPVKYSRTHPKRWTNLQVENLEKDYYKGYSDQYIGEKMGFTTQQVRDKIKNLIKYEGLKPRNKKTE
ncbi:hypothetical protein BLNAU_25265 [Blattamonas nauphoetae]|uniref:Tyr recombinase domain-containing protein n=1 Tax=Blattamonas nauphoetae TaxID=2049346 RepID=A0ABQ9WK31_9EUKA|nr:hypothetical protein BLNAU_25265 [Blattamonas nauphoetae]